MRPMTVFVLGANQKSVPIFVYPTDTADMILQNLAKRQFIPDDYRSTYSLYITGRLRRISGYATMLELGAHALTHFDLRVRVPGGSDSALLSPSPAPQKAKGKNMGAIIDAEQQGSDGEGSEHPPKRRKLQRRGKLRKYKGANGADEEDEEDEDFEEGTDDGSEDEVEVVPTEELAALLPAKSEALRKRNPGKQRNKTPTPVPSSTPASVPTSNQPQSPKSPRKPKKEKVFKNKTGDTVPAGDQAWRCYHGTRKTLVITKAMKGTTNGLVSNLKTASGPMFKLYNLLADRKKADPAFRPSEEEIEVAGGKRVFESDADTNTFLAKIFEGQEVTISHAFERQKAAKAEPWDQNHFVTLLARWVAACDQPFEEVSRPEFRELLQYVYRGNGDLKIPDRKGVRTKIMDMEKELKRKLKKMFSETLIDFRELIGAHSGDNMADAVWETLSEYGLCDRIMAFVMDNATNNNTMMDALEAKCRAQNIVFSAEHARLRCMPHTVHLAALKLLEAIGAVEKDSRKSKKAATTRRENYQEDVVRAAADADEDDDNEEAVMQDADEDWEDEKTFCEGLKSSQSEDAAEEGPSAKAILTAVQRLRRIVRAVCSSPQRRKSWNKEVQVSLDDVEEMLTESASDRTKLMLILDVKTRWSSTHQMLKRALRFKTAVNNFVSRHRELHVYTLTDDDWAAIKLVCEWLELFREATTEMSTTKSPMISTVHSVFRGLQFDIKSHIADLPDDTISEIKQALVNSHMKLSEYFSKFDVSPYYMWAALLDPHISYQSLCEDYADDISLTLDLETAKTKLHAHYNEHYATAAKDSTPGSMEPDPLVAGSSKQPKRKLTDRYNRKPRDLTGTDELTEYFKLDPAKNDFDTCDPIAWWVKHRDDFPKLSKLALDILSIPGSAVAVERIFSGGRDTISLRRSRLEAGTIRALMLVKNRLKMAREDIKLALGE
ncbi:unnamed protein product [Mycena citricolor]|uniref:HAT C-terminal dimerisation domain-containing protein n=1 Tax=Mycena citricolor TaxID=2018698 RepID=A0AAD2K0E1_9AGAR|nr:unnamed protein product [Mycena citricolor]